jgi:purine-binding chemotaxis protein CheW
MHDNTTEAFEAVDSGELVATFFLGEAVFGVRAEDVQEVVRIGRITSVHRAADYVVGIRNLRGRIVTVIDLGLRLHLAPVNISAESRILITDWKGEPIGLMVDEVADTISIDPDKIEPPPPNVHGVRASNLMGVYRVSDTLVAILHLGATLELAG